MRIPDYDRALYNVIGQRRYHDSGCAGQYEKGAIVPVMVGCIGNMAKEYAAHGT